jgi:WD40 repeat protein
METSQQAGRGNGPKPFASSVLCGCFHFEETATLSVRFITFLLLFVVCCLLGYEGFEAQRLVCCVCQFCYFFLGLSTHPMPVFESPYVSPNQKACQPGSGGCSCLIRNAVLLGAEAFSTPQIQAVEFTSTGDRIVSCGKDTLRVWESTTGREVHSIGPDTGAGGVLEVTGHSGKIGCMTTNPYRPGEDEIDQVTWGVITRKS